MKSRIEASLQKVFPHLVPKFRSATWAAITVLRNRTDVTTDCFVVDITSEATNLFAIRDGVATEHLLVPQGSRSILKRVNESGMPEETLTKMRMLALEHCSDAACESLLASISHAEPELVRVFGEAIGTCAALRRLPGVLVLMVHPDMAPWLTRFFSRIDFAQFTSTSQPFVVSLLGSAELAALVQPEKGLVVDPGLLLPCALVNIEKRG
jgi:hypothetical protein